MSMKTESSALDINVESECLDPAKQAFIATMSEIYGNEFPDKGAFAGDHGWSEYWTVFQAGMAFVSQKEKR